MRCWVLDFGGATVSNRGVYGGGVGPPYPEFSWQVPPMGGGDHYIKQVLKVGVWFFLQQKFKKL